MATQITKPSTRKPSIVHTAPRVAKPSAPQRPQAPARPVAAPSMLEKQLAGSVAVTAPQAATMQRLARNGVQAKPTQAPPIDAQALKGEILKLNETIKDLTSRTEKAEKALAAKTRDVRTAAEILDNAENGLQADDWRIEYAGHHLRMYPHTYEQGKRGTDGRTFVVHENETAMIGLLAIPRSTDVGNDGTRERAAGLIAIHWARVEGEKEAYQGQPSYVSQEELGQIWIDLID